MYMNLYSTNFLSKNAIFLALASLLISFLPFSARAAEDKQQECFSQLQNSVSASPTFAPVQEQVKKLTYNDVNKNFSDYYKNGSSFGIDLRSPDFDMRVYSFGRQTGYQHPPFSPFPTYTLSDKWVDPAKEFIIAEEYVRNTETNERIFVSCAFMVIETGSLKKVTAEKYSYDGPLSSILYTAQDGSYKVWYSKNKSYDHSGVEFVTWERLFVYPKSTENEFFSRYTVADAFPVRKTDDLKNIVNDPKDLSGDKDLLNAPELKGYDTVFPLSSYYQTIENTYPAFSEKLALRGVLKWNTVKELLATRGVSEFSALWNTVLDPRDITYYALLKQKGVLVKDNTDGVVQSNEVNPFFEEQLTKIKNLTLDQEAQHLLKTVPTRNPIVDPEANAAGGQSFFGRLTTSGITIGGVALAIVLGGMLVWLRTRRIKKENIVA